MSEYYDPYGYGGYYGGGDYTRSGYGYDPYGYGGGYYGGGGYTGDPAISGGGDPAAASGGDRAGTGTDAPTSRTGDTQRTVDAILSMPLSSVLDIGNRNLPQPAYVAIPGGTTNEQPFPFSFLQIVLLMLLGIGGFYAVRKYAS